MECAFGEAADAEFTFRPFNRQFNTAEGLKALKSKIFASRPDHAISWRALQGKLGRLNRLKIFDVENVNPLNYRNLLKPGHVSIIDLSNSGMSELNNIVIADMLTGIQDEQDNAYEAHDRSRIIRRIDAHACTLPRTTCLR